MPFDLPGATLPLVLPAPLSTPPGVPGAPPPPTPPPIVYLIRPTRLLVLIDGVAVPALAATCSHGVERRYSEAMCRVVALPPGVDPTYWSDIEIRADAVPRGDPPTLRFKGRLRRPRNPLWPKEGILSAAGMLYKAERYKNTAPPLTIAGTTLWPGGTDMVSTLLTGTVAKTEGSATLTGTGTLFTTEVSVGDVLGVRGGSTERRRVMAIASNTSLTVDTAYAYDATAQPAWHLGATDETQYKLMLTRANVTYTPSDIGGTGILFGTQNWDFDLARSGPFTWGDQESGLAYGERIDEVSIDQDSGGNWGQWQGVETIGGIIKRLLITTNPQLVGAADFSLYEHVDLLDGSESDHNTDTVANRIIARGADPLGLGPHEVILAEMSPQLPADFPNGPDGYPEVTYPHPANPMLEKRLTTDAGDGMSVEKMAHYLLARLDAEIVTANLVTHRDEPVSPGMTGYIYAPTRLGIFQRMFVLGTTFEFSEEGVVTQRLQMEVRN